MMTYEAWRQYFEQVTGVPEKEIDLAEAALILGSDADPELNISNWIERLDELAETLRPRLAVGMPGGPLINELSHYLYRELGFHGNREEYDDPRNSYLHEVLARRTGIPISLAVVVLAIAERLALPIVGVGVPGHFCVKWHDPQEELILDPFYGEVLGPEELEARVRETFHPHARFDVEWLRPVGPRYILTRMLNNLKAIFVRTGNVEGAWRVVDKLLILDPRAGDEIRDHGLLSFQLGAYRQAAVRLEQYLLSHADAADVSQVQLYLRMALAEVERLN